jgi:hypothetical protein
MTYRSRVEGAILTGTPLFLAVRSELFAGRTRRSRRLVPRDRLKVVSDSNVRVDLGPSGR